MLCPFCNELIDDDSFYCDICGQKILVCPVCKQPGKGKVCTQHGQRLITTKSILDEVENSAPLPSIQAASVLCEQTGSSIQDDDENSKSSSDKMNFNSKKTSKLKLLNKNIDLDIEIEDNTVIGRTQGVYASIFKSYNRVSGQHCRFNVSSENVWYVTDLESTNGTIYKNQVLLPHTPQSITSNNYLIIANIEFLIKLIQ